MVRIDRVDEVCSYCGDSKHTWEVWNPEHHVTICSSCRNMMHEDHFVRNGLSDEEEIKWLKDFNRPFKKGNSKLCAELRKRADQIKAETEKEEKSEKKQLRFVNIIGFIKR